MIETGTMMKAQALWRSRDEYQVYSLTEFRNKIAQHKRYIVEPTGFVNNRNKEARKQQEREHNAMVNEWNQQLAGVKNEQNNDNDCE